MTKTYIYIYIYTHISRNLLEFEISFNICKKSTKMKMKIFFFYSKQLKCMFKATNNHFIDRSKIKIPKIRPFCISKSEKIVKKYGKIFSASILEDMTYTKLINI